MGLWLKWFSKSVVNQSNRCCKYNLQGIVVILRLTVSSVLPLLKTVDAEDKFTTDYHYVYITWIYTDSQAHLVIEYDANYKDQWGPGCLHVTHIIIVNQDLLF